jgi:group I intron endonuclease
MIRNTVNDKFYIGSAKNIRVRWNNHRKTARKNKNACPLVQRAWNKYGEEALEFSVLITCDPSILVWYEQQFIDQWKPEYNATPTAGNSSGRFVSEETRKKIGDANRGRAVSEETRGKLRVAGTGRKQSEETKAKISLANKGQNLGGTLPEETRKKLSVAIKTARKNKYWSSQKKTR